MNNPVISTITYPNQGLGSSREAVTTTPELTVDETDPKLNVNLTTLNYEGASLWYKLKNAPTYTKAW